MPVTTQVLWGRVRTDAEETTLSEKAIEFVIAGKQEPGFSKSGDLAIKTHTDEAAANEWIDFLNTTFSPPPVSASVVVI